MTYEFVDYGIMTDRDTGHQLEVVSSGGSSRGGILFKLSGPGANLHFNAEMVFPELPQERRAALNIRDGEEICVWQCGTHEDAVLKGEIARALLSYKTSNGFHYQNTVYFVQFGPEGELIHV
jgi:hypothetical protein